MKEIKEVSKETKVIGSVFLAKVIELLKVKSIITLVLTGVFAFLCIKGTLTGEQFMIVFAMIMTFYFAKNKEV